MPLVMFKLFKTVLKSGGNRSKSSQLLLWNRHARIQAHRSKSHNKVQSKHTDPIPFPMEKMKEHGVFSMLMLPSSVSLLHPKQVGPGQMSGCSCGLDEGQ